MTLRYQIPLVLFSSALFAFLMLIPMIALGASFSESVSMLAAFSFTFAIFGSGHIDTMDADPSIETARAILFHGSLATHPTPPHLDFYTEGKFGWYTKVGLSTPLLYIPFVAFAQMASRLLRLPPRETLLFFVSFFNAFVTASIVCTLYFFLRLSLGEASSMGITVVIAFGTLLFPYSKSAHREPLQALSILAAIVLIEHAPSVSDSSHLFLLSGIFIGVGLLTKIALIAALIPCLLYGSTTAFRIGAEPLFYFVLPIGLALLSWFAFTKHAFGGYLKTGYSTNVTNLKSPVWQTKFTAGIFQQWFSVDTGIFFYSPAVMVFICFATYKVRFGMLSLLDFILISTFLIQTAFHARWKSATGDVCLGPRYLVVVLPLFAVFCAHCPVREILEPLPVRIMFFPIVFFSFMSSFVQTAVKSQQYWTLKFRAQDSLTLPHWIANFRIFTHKMNKNPEVYEASWFGGEVGTRIDLRDLPSFAGFNFWWLHLFRLSRGITAEIKPRQTASIR